MNSNTIIKVIIKMSNENSNFDNVSYHTLTLSASRKQRIIESKRRKYLILSLILSGIIVLISGIIQTFLI